MLKFVLLFNIFNQCGFLLFKRENNYDALYHMIYA